VGVRYGRREVRGEAEDEVHRGIAARDIERKFQVRWLVKVKSEELENGLIHVALVRGVPEAMKARKIAIEGSSYDSLLEQNAA